MNTDNGLQAEQYVPLTDVDALVGRHLLTALARTRIPAYLDELPTAERVRLFVAADDRGDARTIVAAVLRAEGTLPPEPQPRHELPPNIDVDSAFQDLVADWHVDTARAIKDAERALSRDDAQWRDRLDTADTEPVWLDEYHYEPPPPPPLPRLAAVTTVAVIMLTLAILMLIFGPRMGLGTTFSLLLGVGGVLVSGGLLITRLRTYRDDDDDGAAV